MSNERTAGFLDIPIDLHLSGTVSEASLNEVRADIHALAGKIGHVGRLGAMELLIGDEISESIEKQKQEQAMREAVENLTNRELEVSGFLIQGLTNAQIAEELGVTSNAVKHHVHNVLKKTGAKTRLEAASLMTWAQHVLDN